MHQLTSRDEAMLDGMNVVRLADVDAIRWALSAYQDDHDGPVSVRRANHWIARMAELGYLGRVRPVYRDRQIVWPTHQSSGRAAPRLFRQTMRHELSVASIAARYVAAGYEWSRDAEEQSGGAHQADGVAWLEGRLTLVEVELTAKSVSRYTKILGHFGDRMTKGDVRVVYFCTSDVARIVSREADRVIFRDQRSYLLTQPVLDHQGAWIGEAPAAFEAWSL